MPLIALIYYTNLLFLANSAIHPSEVGKWVVIHVIRYMDYGVKGWLGRSMRLMPAGSICGSRVRYAGYGRRLSLTCAVPGYYSQCWSVTTSTIVKTPLARASHVKWRYAKYPGFSFLSAQRCPVVLHAVNSHQ